MPRELKPAEMAAPAAAYARGMQVPAGHELVVTSGVVPTRRDGSVPANIGEQAGVVWQNILAMISRRQDDCTRHHLGHYLCCLYVRRGRVATRLKLVMGARDAALNSHLAASTLVTVPALARLNG